MVPPACSLATCGKGASIHPSRAAHRFIDKMADVEKPKKRKGGKKGKGKRKVQEEIEEEEEE